MSLDAYQLIIAGLSGLVQSDGQLMSVPAMRPTRRCVRKLDYFGDKADYTQPLLEVLK